MDYTLYLIFTIVFLITMSILKLKYKKQLTFSKVAKYSFLISIAVYISTLILGLILLEMNGYEYELSIAVEIGSIIGFSIASVIIGIIYYAIARFIIVIPIKKIHALRN